MIATGTQLGRYEIETLLGKGGTGEVYRARDTRLARAVAIKVLTPVTTDAAGLHDRLEREARAISQLSHPHICTLHDIGATTTADGTSVTYLVMELIEGETLEQQLVHGPLPVSAVLTYAAQMADALGYAHRHGVVHGDLKPGNVLMMKSGIKLLDFGLARQRGAAAPAVAPDQVTRTTVVLEPGHVTGTLQYLAPEQIEGGPATEQSDIFACGAVIYEMATGRRVFTGDTPARVIAAILREQPAPPSIVRSELPPALDRLLASTLAKDPDERWQSASDLCRELRWLAERQEPARSPRTTWPWIAAALALVAVVSVVAAALALRRAGDTPVAPLVARTSILLPEGLEFPASATTLGGVGRFSISPDGARLAFVGVDADRTQRLWVRALDSLAAAPIAGTEGAWSPFWSPDSQTIAFVAQGQLKAVTLPGGSPRVIAPTAFNATGTWNGDSILFTPAATSPIHVVSAAGGTPRPVTTLDAAENDIVHRNPYFLPDGRHFLYVAVAAREGGTTPRAIYVGSTDGSEPPTLLIDSGSSVRYSQGHLIFLRETSLVAQPFDLERLALTGEPRTIADQIELTGPASATFSVSTTGALVYQTASAGGSRLIWMSREGQVTGTLGDPARYGDLELSRDGSQLAVSIVDPTTNTRDLWAIDIARGVRTRLTRDAADDVAAVWSPDGTRVAFSSNRRGHFDIFEASSSGLGEPRLVSPDRENGEKYPASWSADGRTLLYWKFEGSRTTLAVLDVESRTATPFVEGPVNLGAFAPDGQHVAYYSAESGRAEVYVVPYPEATTRWQLSTNGGSFPRWSSDGREVFYVGRDNRLMVVPVSPSGRPPQIGVPASLFELRSVGRGYPFTVDPRGERLLVNAEHDNGLSSLTIVQNWATALAR